jgi:chromosome partitioning protein
MASVIAVGNLKGGVSKSFCAVNLGCEIASQRHSVILVDADAQGTASYWLGLGRLPIRGETMPLENQRDADRWIRRVIALRDEADLVVIDLPPHIGAATEAALVIADLFIIPVTASGADILATEKALALLREARQVRGDGKPACLIVPSKVDRRTAAGREIEEALKPLGESIAPAICQRAAFVDSFSAGEWIGDFAPHSPAAAEIEALADTVRGVLKWRRKEQA